MAKISTKNIKNGVMIIFIYIIGMNREGLEEYFLIIRRKIGTEILLL